MSQPWVNTINILQTAYLWIWTSSTDNLSDASYLAGNDSSLENSIVTDHIESDNILEDTSGSTNSLNTGESILAAQKRCGSTVVSYVTEDSGVDMRPRHYGKDLRTKYYTPNGTTNMKATRPKAAGRQRSAAQPSPFLVRCQVELVIIKIRIIPYFARILILYHFKIFKLFYEKTQYNIMRYLCTVH